MESALGPPGTTLRVRTSQGSSRGGPGVGRRFSSTRVGFCGVFAPLSCRDNRGGGLVLELELALFYIDIEQNSQLHKPSPSVGDLETAINSLPFSEHSSYPELRAFVAAVKPRAVVPTVCGSGAAGRRRLVDMHLVDLMDLSSDRTRLDAYFLSYRPQRIPTLPGQPPGSSRAKGAPAPEAAGAAAGAVGCAEPSPLSSARAPPRLLSTPLATPATGGAAKAPPLSCLFTPRASCASPPGLTPHAAPSSPAKRQRPIHREAPFPSEGAPVGGPGSIKSAAGLKPLIAAPVTHLAEILGLGSRDLAEAEGGVEGGVFCYLAALLRDARGDVAEAVAVHFGPNKGLVQPPRADVNGEERPRPEAPVGFASSCSSSSAPPSSVSSSSGGGGVRLRAEAFARGSVCAVVGRDKDFKVFVTRGRAEARLRQV